MKKLYYTKKECIFDYMDSNPDARVTDLYKEFPHIPQGTIRSERYLWQLENKDGVKNLIPHIENVLKVLNHKCVPQKQFSIEEEKSLKILGNLIDKYTGEDL